MKNESSTPTATEVGDAAKIDALLQEIAKTPEGSTAMFTICYCTDRARVDVMKTDPVGTLINVIGERHDDRKALDGMRQRMEEGEIRLLQNEATTGTSCFRPGV